jgi:2-C-methyl-D-erythritol 4-phosphate cytidylyltransferase
VGAPLASADDAHDDPPTIHLPRPGAGPCRRGPAEHLGRGRDVSTAVVVLAGGSGTRLQRAENKVFLPLGGQALLAWSLTAFEASPLVERIVLVVRQGDEDRAADVTGPLRLTKLTGTVVGGSTRHESERAGLEQLAPDIEAGVVDLVAIHDAARPFVREALLERIFEVARRVGGAVPALELTGEFLLHLGTDGAGTPLPTTELRRVQTPQAFQARALLDAHRRAWRAGFQGADTAESVERYSEVEVEVVAGDADNVKVTYLEDLTQAEELARAWDAERPIP